MSFKREEVGLEVDCNSLIKKSDEVKDFMSDLSGMFFLCWCVGHLYGK